jgi:hypothetical protein
VYSYGLGEPVAPGREKLDGRLEGMAITRAISAPRLFNADVDCRAFREDKYKLFADNERISKEEKGEEPCLR